MAARHGKDYIEGLQDDLNAMSKQGRWVEMADLVDDEILNTFAVVGEPERIAPELRRRYGLVLGTDGRHEEAVEELLGAGFVAEAMTSAEHALAAAVGRLDLDLAQSWLDRFAAAGMASARGLLRAQMVVSIAREDFKRAVDQVPDAHRLEDLA